MAEISLADVHSYHERKLAAEDARKHAVQRVALAVASLVGPERSMTRRQDFISRISGVDIAESQLILHGLSRLGLLNEKSEVNVDNALAVEMAEADPVELLDGNTISREDLSALVEEKLAVDTQAHQHELHMREVLKD